MQTISQSRVENKVTNINLAKNALQATTEAITAYQRGEFLSQDEVEALKEQSMQDIYDSAYDMEPLDEKQVESAQRLVKLNHPLNKVEIWKALPFLAKMVKWLPSSSSENDDNFQSVALDEPITNSQVRNNEENDDQFGVQANNEESKATTPVTFAMKDTNADGS